MDTKEPKILLIDIETSPLLGFTWGMWEQNVIETVEDWRMLSFAYKWDDEKAIHAYALPDFTSPYRKNPKDDKELVRKLWELMNEADIIIAHNGDNFDIKKANARFIAHGLTPPKPYKTIDTLKVARQNFKFDSNKLDELGRYFGIGRKLAHTGFHLWKGCMAGDMKSWKLMKKYNKQDVNLLEQVYLKLRPWMKSYPIVSPYCGVCRCGSVHLQKRGFSYTKTYEIQRLQCQECGAWMQGDKVLANQ